MDLAKADRLLRSLKVRSTPYDRALGGSLSCRVAASGAKTISLKMMIHGKQQRLKLGVYPAITIADAYAKAQGLRAQVKMGHDPRVDSRRAEDGTMTPRTVAEAAERFVAEHVKAKNRSAWAREAERIVRADILPRLGAYPLAQLRRSDLSALISSKAAALKARGGTGTVANRLRAVLSKFMGFCEEHGWLSGGIGVRLPRPVAEAPKERTLTPQELGQLWDALDEARKSCGVVQPVYGHVLALLALTGCRCGEVVGLRRAAVDLEAGTIAISNGKTKASNRVLPLPALARGIVAGAAEGKEPDDLLFPLPRAGTEIPSNEVSRAARKIVTALGHNLWTPHDLRRTAVSIMAEEGVDGDVRRRITGHLAQDVHGRVYDRASRLSDVREGLAVVEHFILCQAQDLMKRPTC